MCKSLCFPTTPPKLNFPVRPNRLSTVFSTPCGKHFRNPCQKVKNNHLFSRFSRFYGSSSSLDFIGESSVLTALCFVGKVLSNSVQGNRETGRVVSWEVCVGAHVGAPFPKKSPQRGVSSPSRRLPAGSRQYFPEEPLFTGIKHLHSMEILGKLVLVPGNQKTISACFYI